MTVPGDPAGEIHREIRVTPEGSTALGQAYNLSVTGTQNRGAQADP